MPQPLGWPNHYLTAHRTAHSGSTQKQNEYGKPCHAPKKIFGAVKISVQAIHKLPHSDNRNIYQNANQKKAALP
jgi:hypothetical protein